MNDELFWERNLYAHQRGKLLSSMEVSIPQIPLGKRAGNGKLEGERVIARKETHRLHRARVERGKRLRVQALRGFDKLVVFLVIKQDVNSQQEWSILPSATHD